MKRQRIISVTGSVLLVCAFVFLSISCSSSKNESAIPENNGEVSNNTENSSGSNNTENSSGTNNTEKDISDVTDNETTVQTTAIETSVPFTYSDNQKGLSLGEIGKDGDFYIGLANVRISKNVQTALKIHSSDVPKNSEVVYPIVQVYNSSNDLNDFDYDSLEVYVDSVQANAPDTTYLSAIDNIVELNFSEIDCHRMAVSTDAFVVEKGWSEMTVFCGNISWTLKKDEVNTKTYEFQSLFNVEPDYKFTEVGSKIYDGDYELIYDGFKIHTFKHSLYGKLKYALFEFTINNTSENDLDYTMVGYRMRAYRNSFLLGAPSWSMNDKIDGYANVHDVDSIRPGMSAKVYVAFEVKDSNGVFECCYDTGYINHNCIAYACTQT